MKQGADELDLGFEQLAELAGISTVTAWRVTKGEGTVKAASAMLEALKNHAFKVGGTVDLPPPIMSAPGPELAEWAQLGQQLLAADRDQFDKALARVRKLVEALEGVEDDMSLIAHPLPRKRT